MKSLVNNIRSILVRIYRGLYLFRLLVVIGKINILFYKVLFPNLFFGKSPCVWGSFYVMMYDPKASKINFGDNIHMVSDFRRSGITLYSPCKFTTIAQGLIEIGDNVQLNGVCITSRKCVKIGSGTLVAPNCIIVDSNFHVTWPPENRGYSNALNDDREVLIGDNVWIGMNVTILKGSIIGNNSIISAGSVVTGEIPPNVIASGNPAEIVKTLECR
jgi:acetyltransferase-like isoleucine patch superfamily enzyme